MKNHLFALGVSACLVAACSQHGTAEATSESSAAIIGGAHDTGDPAVVLVNADYGNGTGSWCTGSVIAKRVVLTAAHCVEDATSQTRFSILFGSDPISGKPDATINVVKFAHDPEYMVTNNIAAGHDAAVLILAQDAPVTPLAINTTALTQSMIGSPVYVVGYGNDNGVAGTGAGTKRSVHTKLANLEQGVIDIGQPGQTTCQGDSGGPTFMTVNGRSVIVGITSYGEEGCVSAGSSTRVDLSTSFIQPYIDANGGNVDAGGPDVGTATNTNPNDNPATNSGSGSTSTCVFKCSDYGYAPGQCYQGWYCLPDGEDAGCLGQTTC